MMPEISDLRSDEERAAAIQLAADELADRLKELADALSVRGKTRRVRYGRGRIGHSLKRLSPEGFVIDPANLAVLLPDGRLWAYSRSDATRFPMGRYYDPRTDHIQFAGNRTFPNGREFVFLGAVLGAYTFGVASGQDGGDHADSPGLCAIFGEGRSVRYLTADEAFAAIAESAPSAEVDYRAETHGHPRILVNENAVDGDR